MCFNELAYLTTRYLVNTLRAVRLDVCLSSKRGERLEKRITPSQAERLERADSLCKNGSED